MKWEDLPLAQVFCALTSIALALALAWDYFKASASQNKGEAVAFHVSNGVTLMARCCISTRSRTRTLR